MEAGKLDRRVTLLRHTVATTNGFGEPSEGWAPAETVWAGKLDVSDAERVRAMGVGSVLTTRFVVRSSSATRSLTTLDRLRYAGADYEISGIKEIGRREGLEITAATLVELSDAGLGNG